MLQDTMLILKEAPNSTDTTVTNFFFCFVSETIKCADDIVNRAMYRLLYYVGEGLLQRESFLLPSVYETFHAVTADADAHYRHWKRVCWVLDMWSQADIG